jgi:hypothetical protein
MKSRFLIFTSLVLAVLCLGSASSAMAQSVTGAAVFTGGNGAPLTINVSAKVGDSGPTGTIRSGVGEAEFVAQVVDLCFNGNQVGVVGLTTTAQGPVPPGYFIVLTFQDNGSGSNTDLINGVPFPIPMFIPACDLLGFAPPNFPIQHGNIKVTP